MRHLLWLTCLWSITFELPAQTFEVGSLQEVYRGHIGETVKVPLQLTNNTDKPISLLIRRIGANLGGTQKNYLCPENNCQDQQIQDFTIRLEPRETLNNFLIALEAGLADGASSVKYLVINRYNPAETMEFDLNFSVSERSDRESVFSDPHIVLHDIYPNPIVDFAFINYEMTNDEVKAKIIIHNILGNLIDEYDLPSAENRVKIRAESMSAGIYFYTLYLDNEGVITRKLIVKK